MDVLAVTEQQTAAFGRSKADDDSFYGADSKKHLDFLKRVRNNVESFTQERAGDAELTMATVAHKELSS